MKTAAILLAAVTFFTSLLQQFSTAPTANYKLTNSIEEGNKNEELVKLVKKDIETSEAAYNIIVKAVKEALAEATSDKKDLLTKCKNWFDGFGELVATIHKELLESVTAGTKEALERILSLLSKAIKDTEIDLPKVIKNLKGDLKALIEEKLNFILNNAYTVRKGIKNFLAGKRVDASAINAGENIEQNIEELVKLVKKDIETSEAAYDIIVKAVKKALAEATSDKKELLTKCKNWFDSFGELVATIHKELLESVTAGTKEALERILSLLSKAIKDTEIDLPKVIKNLKGDLKALIEEKLNFILNNAYTVRKGIKNFLAGKRVDASAINAGENIEQNIEELVKLVKKDIETSEAAYDIIVKAVKQALAEATSDKKELLTKCKNWFDGFGELVTTIHKELLESVTAGTKEALERILSLLSKAIKDTEIDLPKVIKNLKGDLKALIEEKLNFILNNAYTVRKGIKNFLAGKRVDASAINAGENIEQNIEELVKLVKKDIETSEAAYDIIVKAVKKALAEATSDKKELLTKCKNWFDGFGELVTTIHKELLESVTAGTKEALERILSLLSKAIKDTEIDLPKVIKNLKGDLKALIEEKLNFILNNAYTVRKGIKNFLAGKRVDASAINAGKNIEQNIVELVKLVKKDIETSEAAYDIIVKAVKQALAEATSDKKELLTKCKNWFDGFGELVATIHKELLESATAGTKEALERILSLLSKAIKDTEIDLPKVINNLEGDLKALIEEKLNFILNNAYTVRKEIKNFLAGKRVDASAINAGENIEQNIEELVKLVKKDIETSEAAYDIIVKAIKKVLAEATSDKKELLTKCKNWFDGFGELVTTIHKELPESVTAGTKEALERILSLLSKAIKDAEIDLPKVIKNLKGDLKALIEEKLNFILNNAYTVRKGIKNFLAGKRVDASAINAGKNIEQNILELVKLVKKDIETSEAAYDIIVKAVKQALAEATNDKKELLIKCKNWFDSFGELVATIHKELLESATAGTKEALERILYLLSKAIKDTEKDLPKVINNLEGDLKALIEEKLNFILNNAYTVRKGIKNFLAGKRVDASAINAGENIEQNIEELVKLVKKDIETSEAAYDIIVKAVKQALAEATSDKKELLTKCKNWFDGFGELVATIHKELLESATAGTKEALECILSLLSKAIKDTEIDLPKVINNLEGDLKALIEEKLNFILNNAYTVRKEIKNFLAGKRVDASAINAGENIEQNIEELVKLVKKDIETSEAAYDIIVKAVKQALAEATSDKKELLTKCKNWFDGFGELVATIHKELLESVTAGTKEALERILSLLSKAIKYTEIDLPKVIKNLKGDLKALIEEKLNFILNNAYTVRKGIKNFLAGKRVDASAINAGKNIEQNIEELVKLVKKDIETSEAAYDIIVKAVKQALAKATSDKKELLTKCKNWLDGFGELVTTIHKELLECVTAGTKEVLKSILSLLSKAIKDTETDLPKVINNLEGDIKALFEEKLNFILNNAYTVRKGIKNAINAQ